MPKKTKKSKEDKLFDNILKVTRQFMLGRSFVPLTMKELMEKLTLPPQHKDIFKQALQTLVQRGEVTFSKNRYSLTRTKDDVLTGTIRMHPRGFGFVESDNQVLFPEDIFIPKHLTKNAVDGDKVEILINQDSISEKGPEGKVLSITQRGRTHIAGIIRNIDQQGQVIAYVPMLGLSQRVVVEPGPDRSLIVGDRIIMEVIDWGTKESETLCRYSHYLSHISDHRGDTQAAIEEYELRKDFPTSCIEEAQKFGSSVKIKDIKGREDFRDLECFTIDPDTAKDFDDALSLTKDRHGNYHLGVHIADVTHYVSPGSALDKEAELRANSTYFPGFCLPMLPKELSNNLCSLKPNVNRLTVSVMMIIDKNGDLKSYRIVRSVIKSKKRFTYKEAKKILDKTKESIHEKTLRTMEKLCHLLKRKRFERGSLDLSLSELIVIVDEDGLPTKTENVEYDITHQIVEEFMLKANEIVATHLSEAGKPLTYRVHETPPEENLKEFATMARAFGFDLPANPTQEELQSFFYKAIETPYGQHLSACYIKRMRMAIYSPENIGHYGLSLSHYCHFTSPIRRYADLIVHRVLLGEEISLDQIEKISNHCSTQERISAKAESSVILLKKLRLLDAIHKEEPWKEFEAVITQVRAWGLTLDILAFMFESFIHISEIGDDYFEFQERKMQLRGTSTNVIYRSGDTVTVRLVTIDFITLQNKWEIFSENEDLPSKQKKFRRPKKNKNRRGD